MAGAHRGQLLVCELHALQQRAQVLGELSARHAGLQLQRLRRHRARRPLQVVRHVQQALGKALWAGEAISAPWFEFLASVWMEPFCKY